MEFALEFAFLPWLPKTHWLPIFMGSICLVLGECIRKLGIITAGSNFTLKVQTQKSDQHKLVTWGIYRYIRHPGYSGWLLWAIGTQIVLCNPICIVSFAVIVSRFTLAIQESNALYLQTRQFCFNGKPFLFVFSGLQFHEETHCIRRTIFVYLFWRQLVALETTSSKWNTIHPLNQLPLFDLELANLAMNK